MARLKVHNLFLWFMATIYLFAFASLYHQLPGLYGEKGIIPVSNVLHQPEKTPSLALEHLLDKFMNVKPTLLWTTQAMGLELQAALDFLALAGIALASFAIVTRFARNIIVFGLLWLLYLSFHSVGNVFLWFQWDALLLEAGFLAFVFAPIPFFMSQRLQERLTSLSMWPVRWLFFRLMFMSGVVKLQSHCPTWWNLTALHHHYESQCIPTFVAWYVHQLPGWFDKLTVLFSLFSEIVIPFLFFAPTRGIRKFAFYNQVVLQIGIIITGNYNFFNLLTIALSLSLLDDEDLGYFKKKHAPKWLASIVSNLFNIFVIGGLLVITGVLYNVHYDTKEILKFNAGFTENEFNKAVSYMWPASVGLAGFSLLWNLILYFRDDVKGGILVRLYHLVFFVLHLSMVLVLFFLSLSPYSSISPSTNLGTLGTNVRSVHRSLDRFNIVNGYGLFRRMTGVEGRPEVILEGSDDLESGWKPYEFQYKPGRLDRAPPFIVPHQPRLDWQMWFAALSDQRMNPWVHSLVYRLLKGEKDVIRLLDPSTPYVTKPPRYIRGLLYKYWFTNVDDSTSNWWRRKFDREWLSPVSLEDELFIKSVTAQGIFDRKPMKKSKAFEQLRTWLRNIREVAESVEAPIFIWSLFMLAVIFGRIFKAVRL